MNTVKNKKQDKGFFKRLFNDYKIVVSSEETFEEKLSIKASKINVFAVMLVYSVILILFTTRFSNFGNVIIHSRLIIYYVGTVLGSRIHTIVIIMYNIIQ